MRRPPVGLATLVLVLVRQMQIQMLQLLMLNYDDLCVDQPQHVHR
jgi:hypothetical protein